MDRLSIAIRIASMNRAAMLRKCLASCASPTDRPDRLAVIDGGSTDGTLEVILEFRPLLTYSISEPVKESVESLDKRLRQVKATDHVLVLGSDHRLYDDHVLVDLRQKIAANPGHSIYYGPVKMEEEKEDERQTAARRVPSRDVLDKHLAGRLSGMPHQVTFQLADSLLRFGGFDAQYRI